MTAQIERWPVAGAFTIARGAKTHVDVVVAEIAQGLVRGRGEATPIYYHDETPETVVAAIKGVADAIAMGVDRAALAGLLPRGAARNAVDAALWDFEAKLAGVDAWRLAGLERPQALTTAYTISLGDPAEMEMRARAAHGRPLLKLKLAGDGDVDRVAAVRRGAPTARLIVDANESWTDRDVAREVAALEPFGVELIEQPVAAGRDALLDGVVSTIPFCADESCQDRADLARCVGRYAAVNVKLDKAGGLTEALALVREAREAGLEVMVGCMLSTSLGIAPAFLAAQGVRWVDLDGPLLLEKDRPGGFRFKGSVMRPGRDGFWG